MNVLSPPSLPFGLRHLNDKSYSNIYAALSLTKERVLMDSTRHRDTESVTLVPRGCTPWAAADESREFCCEIRVGYHLHA